MNAETDRQYRLGDGRRLGCAEFGDPRGRPVLYFHGFPSSRLEARLADRAAARLGVRLIAVDRPGFGLSDRKPGRTFGDWPDDVLELATLLGLERFAVLGVSGGGPYALACAWKIRSTSPPPASSAVSAPGRCAPSRTFCRWGYVPVCDFPTAGRISRAPCSWGWHLGYGIFPRRFLQFHLPRHGTGPTGARAGASTPSTTHRRTRVLPPGRSRRSMRNATLHLRPWDFDLRDITMEVRLWHGEHDAVVPVSVCRDQVARLPNCQARFYPEEGHYSLPVGHMEEILGALVV